MSKKTEVAVIGCGIIGMTTALRLSEAGWSPIVISKDDYSSTTSAAAAAFWYPYHAEPAIKVSAWAEKSLAVYRIHNDDAATGVRWTEFTEYFVPEASDPWWSNLVDNYRRLGLVELAAGSRSASSFAVPVIDTSVYLNYVHDLLRSRQVQFVSSDLSSLEEALAWAPSIVNCSGVGAIQLAKDSDLHPARGQIVRIKRRPDHAGFVDLTQEPAIAHVTPRTHDTVLGGTYEANVSTLAPDWDEAARTLERCQAICPALASISLEDVLGISCGLRPVRSSVRVEAEHVNGHPIVHNYGHGGAGFTLAWGCAEEVCLLLDKAVQQSV